MHLRSLDLNLLVILNVLLEERNITRTGQRIYLSQSATSGALARLRDFFRDDLLVQMGNRMVLTPLAESLVLPIRDLIIQAQGVIDQKPEFDAATSTRDFRLMMSDYMAAVLMTKVAPRLRDLAPSICLDISPLSDLPREKLDRGEIDLLIMPDRFLSSEHPSRELFRDGCVCLVWSGNQEVGSVISEDQYFSSAHVGVRFGTHLNDSLDDWLFQSNGRFRRMGMTTFIYSLVPQLLVGTNYVGTVHRLFAQRVTEFLPLRIVEPQFELPVLTEKMQWNRLRDRDPSLNWIIELLKDTAVALMFTEQGRLSPSGVERLLAHSEAFARAGQPSVI